MNLHGALMQIKWKGDWGVDDFKRPTYSDPNRIIKIMTGDK